MKLSKENIESINSFGPFNHSVWKKDDIVITQEEVLTGRADFLVFKIKEIITNHFTVAEIKKMSIVDIGCYDGYILQELSDLPFKKMVGIEPRQKNIDKGKSIRKVLAIKEKIVFKKNTLEDLDTEKFDIVLCIGVLHHVESISTAIKKLDSVCNRMLILENLCISSKHITDAFKIDIEMKDIVYKSEKLCGLTGQKFESSYYDGSAASSAVVSIPSIETMMMHLTSLGHTNFSVAATPEDFSKAMMKNTRPSKEVLIYSLKEQKTGGNDKTILDYEYGLLSTHLDDELILSLYQKFVLGGKGKALSSEVKKIVEYVEGKGNVPVFEEKNENYFLIEIIRNMKFNTIDKVAFEFAKNRYQNKQFTEAIDILSKIVQKLNSDWRTCYRSFYLLSKIYADLKKKSASNKYIKLCKTCNPDYPLLSNK